jgi:hypothetical protein
MIRRRDGEICWRDGEIVRTFKKMARWRDCEIARRRVDLMMRLRGRLAKWRDREIACQDGEMARWRDEINCALSREALKYCHRFGSFSYPSTSLRVYVTNADSLNSRPPELMRCSKGTSRKSWTNNPDEVRYGPLPQSFPQWYSIVAYTMIMSSGLLIKNICLN